MENPISVYGLFFLQVAALSERHLSGMNVFGRYDPEWIRLAFTEVTQLRTNQVGIYYCTKIHPVHDIPIFELL
jgi:hypothetical protein